MRDEAMLHDPVPSGRLSRLLIPLSLVLAAALAPAAVQAAKTDIVVLKNGDELVVPDRQQEVSVIGEVQYPTSHLFETGLMRDDYVNRSGESRSVATASAFTLSAQMARLWRGNDAGFLAATLIRFKPVTRLWFHWNWTGHWQDGRR